MSTVESLRDELANAVETVQGVRVHSPGRDISPPAVSIGAPTLSWAAGPGDVDAVTFPLLVVVAADARAMPRLWDLVPRVAEAVDNAVTDAVVRTATPTFFQAGGSELPAYALTVECAVG